MTKGGWADLITTDRVLELHNELVTLEGTAATPRDAAIACVRGCLGNALNAACYCQTDDPSLAFAGYSLFYLVSDHCFTDGNKRIGWSVAVEVLGGRGFVIDTTNEEAVALVTRIASHDIEQNEVLDWLGERVAHNSPHELEIETPNE